MPESKHIILTGKVIVPGTIEFDEKVISADEVGEYTRKGWLVTEFQGEQYASKAIPYKDGDIVLSSRLDKAGEYAARGRHTNLGYSGYFTPYIYKKGKRTKIKDYHKLFPNKENTYKMQKEKDHVFEQVQAIISSWKGRTAVKVFGGFTFNPEMEA